jgi:hypothetical protein
MTAQEIAVRSAHVDASLYELLGGIAACTRRCARASAACGSDADMAAMAVLHSGSARRGRASEGRLVFGGRDGDEDHQRLRRDLGRDPATDHHHRHGYAGSVASPVSWPQARWQETNSARSARSMAPGWASRGRAVNVQPLIQ